MSITLFEEALELVEQGRFEDAEPRLVELYNAHPHDGRVNYLLGLTYSHFGNANRALNHLIAASKVATGRPEVFSELADAYGKVGAFDESLAAARRAVTIDGNFESAQIRLGDAYLMLQKADMARKAYEKALEIDPKSVSAYMGLHRLDTSLGDLEQALDHLNAAYELEPNNEYVLLAAANNSEFQSRPEVLERILSVLAGENPNLSPEVVAQLNFAAGKLFEQSGDIEKAFDYYAKYKTAMYQPYDINLRKWQLETIKGMFSEDFFSHRNHYGLKSSRPIFVVGMPRSGTTLVEQILGRHPKAAGVGEVIFFPRLQNELSGAPVVTPALFERAITASPKEYQRMGNKYLAELDKFDKKASRVIDKTPHNFEMLWMIALIFPNAKIIHVHREPADTCTSIYTTPLQSPHAYNRDLETLGEYYGLYAEMMEHWDKVLPIRIHHQSYEALINNQEAETRALLEYVGLPWDEACLDTQSGDRPVFTFSIQQVRQPIYSSSIGRWKKYGSHIQPLLKALGSHAPKDSSETV
jgi:tetratricopeptide (TPR) repeat protein